MRYVITVDSEQSTAVSARFGRAPYFLLIEDEGRRLIDNEGHKQEHGAGIRAAQQVMDLAPDVLMTGRLGPKAEQVLAQSDVRIVYTQGSIEDMLSQQARSGEGEHESQDTPAEGSEQHSRNQAAPDTHTHRVLIAASDNRGREATVCDHFGHAPYFAVYDNTLRFLENQLDHNTERSPVQQLVEWLGPDVVVVKGIGQRAIRLFGEYGVELRKAGYETVGEVLDNIQGLSEEVTDCGH